MSPKKEQDQMVIPIILHIGVRLIMNHFDPTEKIEPSVTSEVTLLGVHFDEMKHHERKT